jgi:hypothetical protein
MVTPRRVVFCFDERSLEPVAKLVEQGRLPLEGCTCPLCAVAKERVRSEDISSLDKAWPVSLCWCLTKHKPW